MKPMRAIALAWVLILAGPAIAAEDMRASDGRMRMTFLVTSGLDGRLIDTSGATAAGVAAKVRELSATAEARGDAVVVFDAGRTLLPNADSRQDGGLSMAAVLTAAGSQAFTPGATDFTLGLDAMNHLASTVPYPILRPFSGFDPKLEAFEGEALLVPRGEAEGAPPVVLVSLFDAFYEGNLSKSGIAASLTSPDEALTGIEEDVSALRVAVVHSSSEGSSMLSRRLTWDLVEKPAGFDILIDPDFGHDVILHRQDDDAPVLLVGRERRGDPPWTVAEIIVDLEERRGRWQPALATLEIHGIDSEMAVDADLESEIRSRLAEIRRAGSRRLPASAPDSRDELVTFVLETVREAADAEVAILNHGALQEVAPGFFAQGALRVDAVRRLLTFDQFLIVGELTGAELSALWAESRSRVDEDGEPLKTALRFLGLESSESGKLEINGRRLYPKDTYRVVTNSFLASGGDDYPLLVSLPNAENVRLPSGRLGEVRDDFVLPRLEEAERPFVDLGSRGLWRYGLDRVALSAEGVQTTADSAYRTSLDSRASAGDSASLLATIVLRADQEWRGLRWENRLRGRFGLLDADDQPSTELEDDLRFEISALFTDETFLGAQPYASLIFDSEFRRNEGPDGNLLPRQFEQNLAAGLRWQTVTWPLIRLGVVARHQSDFEDADRLGVFAEAELLLPRSGWWPAVEGRFFAENLEDSAATIRRLDASLELRFPLGELLSFTPELNYYVYDDSRLPGAARYHRLSLGLTYSWIGKYQRR